MTAPIWGPVDALTRDRRHKLHRDGGIIEHVITPSLWHQLQDAIAQGGESSASGLSQPKSRPPLDVAVVALTTQIDRDTRRTLREWGLTPHDHTPAAIRQLAAHLPQCSAEDQAWWPTRCASWVAQAEAHLGGEDGGPRTRGLRGFSCPDCRARHVTRTQDGEDHLEPAVVAVFNEGRVRSVMCRSCGANWWRGAGLDLLTEHASRGQSWRSA